MPYTFTKTRKNTSILDWEGMLLALKETGFDGVLNFETAPILDTFPDELKEDVLHMLVRIGEYFRKTING